MYQFALLAKLNVIFCFLCLFVTLGSANLLQMQDSFHSQVSRSLVTRWVEISTVF